MIVDDLEEIDLISSGVDIAFKIIIFIFKTFYNTDRDWFLRLMKLKLFFQVCVEDCI